MIRRPDGGPYKLKGSLQQFDPNSLSHDLFQRYDEEMIKISGTPIIYYEVMIQEQTVDPLYLEDRGKLFSPCGITLYAFYEPPQQMNMSGLFAIDTPDEEIILELNYKAVQRELCGRGSGPMPKIGSRIYTPHRGENWIIIDYRLDQFKLWGALRLMLHCKKFQETTTTGEGNVTQPQPDFRITD
jgi:hypothetical protein